MRKPLVARRPERHRGRRLREKRRADDRASLLIDADQRVRSEHVMQVAGEGADFVLVAKIVAKQHDRANAIATEKGRLFGIERLAANADHHKLARMKNL